MSLLDGKYEIIRQSAPSQGRTLFEATAPDGTLLRIEWFELEPAEEPTFERYRRVLKVLKRDGKAAVYDVISRPGAHYVAWERSNGSVPAVDDGIRGTLDQHGFAAAAADVRRSGRSVRLYGLAWDGEPAAAESERAEVPGSPPPTRLPVLSRLPEWAVSTSLALVMLMAAAALLAGGFLRRANDRVVVVPDVVGDDVNLAASTLQRLGLLVDPVPRASSAATGTVLAVDPIPGTEQRPGRHVRLLYALPAGELATTKAPQLVGLAYPDEVLARLRVAGLVLGDVDRVNAATPAGVVLAQSKPAGSAVGEGQGVDVLVSIGPTAPLTFLPDLVGLDVEEARRLAAVAGLAPDQVLEDPVSAPNGAPGEVLSQSIAPYVAVPTAEATLRLIVQRGTGLAPTESGVPNLTGLSEAEARALLPGAKIRLARVATDALPEGIIAQVPPPGGELGSDGLTLTINQHPVALRPAVVRVTIERPAPRCVPYAWTIQPGIGSVIAEVYATPVGGRTTVAKRTAVRGGQVLQGCWDTTFPGPVTFSLTLGGAAYGERLLVP